MFIKKALTKVRKYSTIMNVAFANISRKERKNEKNISNHSICIHDHFALRIPDER